MRAPLRYQPYYCEENIWHLSADESFAECCTRVCLVTNDLHSCPLWRQRLAEAPDLPVWWDYHVFLLAWDAGKWEVWDPDSVLPFPVDAHGYTALTFGAAAWLPPRFLPRFRIVDATTFRAAFASDRAHMRAADGTYTAAPPPWPAISPCPDAPSNLSQFLDMDHAFLGDVLNLQQFLSYVLSAPGADSGAASPAH
ncbi:MAG: hypothetical protein HYV63_34355 [Candidatus Schekmanbacteria bacterium]|nr:hypothetical protein [Candidatus Schekmanbacteria bacterium]